MAATLLYSGGDFSSEEPSALQGGGAGQELVVDLVVVQARS